MTKISKEAKAIYDREYRAKNKERIVAAKRQYVADNLEKENARSKAWGEANKERLLAIKKAYRDRHPAPRSTRVLLTPAEIIRRQVVRVRAWRAANPEKYAKQLACFTNKPRTPEQKARHAEGELKRSQALRRAQPVWADTDAIAAIYAKARAVGKHVDHILPIKGKLVSGLHVPNNLQLLTRTENSRKRNKFDLEAANAS